MADKHFSADKVKGSETLRGKVIIVFGPPSGFEQSGSRDSMGRVITDRGDLGYASAGVADPHSNVGPGASGLMVSAKEPIFSILYDQRASPKPIGTAFRVDLKMKSPAKQEAVDPKDLETKFEVVAKASLRQ